MLYNYPRNREVIQITPRFEVQLIFNCTATTVALNPINKTLQEPYKNYKNPTRTKFYPRSSHSDKISRSSGNDS